ncbi:MAG: GNAT family N-acetyltransferase [Acidimicrobiales bacterium]
MSIRRAAPADSSIVAQLIRELASYEQLSGEVTWAEDELRVALFGPGAVPRVLLAEAPDGEVAGFALYFASFSTFLGKPGIWLEDLYVRPAHRRSGHGRALLGALRALTDGRVEWNVLNWNDEAIGFYESLGARPVEGWVTYRWLVGTADRGRPTPDQYGPRVVGGSGIDGIGAW